MTKNVVKLNNQDFFPLEFNTELAHFPRFLARANHCVNEERKKRPNENHFAKLENNPVTACTIYLVVFTNFFIKFQIRFSSRLTAPFNLCLIYLKIT